MDATEAENEVVGETQADENARSSTVEDSEEISEGEHTLNAHKNALPEDSEKEQHIDTDHDLNQITGEEESPLNNVIDYPTAKTSAELHNENMREADASVTFDPSVTFKEGEGPENGPPIGEPLEGIIKEYEDDINDGPPGIDSMTPNGEKSNSASPQHAKEEETEDPGIDYIGVLTELQNEKQKLSQHNVQLQFKLVEYFRRKTGDEPKPERERDKVVSDQEQRFQKYIDIMEDLKNQQRHDSELHQQQAEELQKQVQAKLEQVDQEWLTFMEQKRAVAVTVLSRRLGKQAAQAEVEQIQAAEQRRENELVAVRQKNIKLKNNTNKLEAELRAKEELAEGLHLIDFEQLKIENQTYNEKIEERNEELLKLRKKITSTVQVLTHVKEKLQFVQVENQAKRLELADVDALVAQKRDALTRTKQARDGLRMDNLRQRQRCGLLGNETLLRDFEEKVDASDALEQRLEMLKRRHAELILKCAGVKNKLEQTKLTEH